jgi:hypothetical protein
MALSGENDGKESQIPANDCDLLLSEMRDEDFHTDQRWIW